MPSSVVRVRGEEVAVAAASAPPEVVTNLDPPPPPTPLPEVSPPAPAIGPSTRAPDRPLEHSIELEAGQQAAAGSGPAVAHEDEVPMDELGGAVVENDSRSVVSEASEVRDLETEVKRLRHLLEAHGIDPESEPPLPAPAPVPSMPTVGRPTGSLLSRNVGAVPPDLAPEPMTDEAFFFLTNRLAPIKVATRVLANMRGQGEWPPLREFQLSAAIAARELGLRLKKSDQQNGIPPTDRRSTGFPVGPQERNSLDAFVDRFTLTEQGAGPGGPLAVLGLATARTGRAVLTHAGWRLGTESSPLIDGVAGRSLSAAEQTILLEQLQKASRELALVREFLGFAAVGRGIPAIVDEFLADSHPEWGNDVASWRSAMLGRLRELDVVQVEGRAAKTRIKLLPVGMGLLEQS